MRRLDILLSGLTFPEAPRWREDKLWFSDFYSYRVMTVGLDGRDDTVAEVPGRPSGLGWTAEGGRVAEDIPTGKRHSYACMLGGPGRNTLFVLTNTGSGPGMAGKRDGCIEAVQVEVPGAGLP